MLSQLPLKTGQTQNQTCKFHYFNSPVTIGKYVKVNETGMQLLLA